MKSLGFLLALVCVAGCSPPTTPSITYYKGSIAYTSPDGKIPYNQTEALLKREVAEGVVVETRTEPGRSPSMLPQQTLTRHRLDGNKASEANIRMVRKVDGKLPMQAVEEYRPISQAEYERALREMLPPKGSE